MIKEENPPSQALSRRKKEILGRGQIFNAPISNACNFLIYHDYVFNDIIFILTIVI